MGVVGQCNLNTMKVLLALSFFVVGSLAQYHEPAPYHAPAPAPYHPPAPAPYHPPAPAYHEGKIPPKPFVSEYGGEDPYGAAFAKTESQDEAGVVHGEYRVQQPDGRTRIVTYYADHEKGFVADVKYEGEAIPYVAPPPKPHHAAPAYAPAPPPYKSAVRAPYARQ